MAAGPRERVHRTRPTGQLARRPHSDLHLCSLVEPGPGRELVRRVGARIAALWRGIGIGRRLAAGARGRDSWPPHPPKAFLLMIFFAALDMTTWPTPGPKWSRWPAISAMTQSPDRDNAS
jgi:hypothetical protein